MGVVTMTVRYDEISQRWRVVDHDGSVHEEFESNAQAWRWIDEHSNSKMDDTRQRVSNAIRQW